MSNNNEFDDIARRKLDERTIPFEEGHWMEAQRLIVAKRKNRKGGAFWYTAGIGALVLGGWLLWQSNEGVTMAEQPAKEEVTVLQKMTSEAEGATAGAEHVATAEAVNAFDETTRPEETAQEQGARTSSNTTAHRPAGTSGNDATKVHAQVAPTMQHAGSGHASITGTSPSITGTMQIEAAIGHVPAVVDAVDTTHSTNGSSAQGDEPAGVVSDAAIGAVVVTTPMDATTAVVTPTATPDLVATTPADEPISPAASIDPSTAANDAPPTMDVVPADPTTAATTPNDSVAALVPPAPVPPPIIPARAPWELSLLGGVFQTTSIYTGFARIAPEVSPERTGGFGGELVHMGRNFGFGGGLHYGTYADRLRTPDEYGTNYVTNQSWYLALVDTTILIITGYDTITGFYTGQNVDVTISQLRSLLDSTNTTTLVRAGREVVNRTSYVEVVGLLDGHLVQGRWSLGIRGGPTFGLLTTRQGSFPGNSEGYTDFNDVAMQTIVLGWTARAYVRYRFNSAWSVGLEPAARGQFMDSFEEQGITRRSNALGVMLSLSYRLP